MPKLNSLNNLPTVPGSGQGPGTAGPSVSTPQGPPLTHTTGLAARTSAGGNLQRPRNSALPPPGMNPGMARPASGGPQTSRLPRPVGTGADGTKPAGLRPQAAGPATARPAAQQTSTPGPSLTGRPAATGRPPAPIAPPGRPNVQRPSQNAQPIATERPSTTTQNVAPSTAGKAGSTASIDWHTPIPVSSMAYLPTLAAEGEVQLPPIVVTPPPDSTGVGEAGGASNGLAAKTLAANEDGVQEAAKHADATMLQMQAVVGLNIKHQLEMSLMKMITDMSNALAKELKKTGEAVKNLAG